MNEDKIKAEIFGKCVDNCLDRISKNGEMPWLKDCIPNEKEWVKKPIFRIECFCDFLKNLNNKNLFFRHPSKWEDTYDSIFVRANIEFPDKTSLPQSYEKNYFCQCWSTEHTERMWRLYSKDYKSVMLVSTVKHVMAEIWENNCTRYAGKVQYFPLSEIKKQSFLESIFGHYSYMINSRGIAETFLFKDDFYKHESEVRFIVMVNGEKKRGSLPIYCELGKCIQYVIVDPRADDAFFLTVQNALKVFNLKVEKADKWYQSPVTYKFTKK